MKAGAECSGHSYPDPGCAPSGEARMSSSSSLSHAIITIIIILVSQPDTHLTSHHTFHCCTPHEIFPACVVLISNYLSSTFSCSRPPHPLLRAPSPAWSLHCVRRVIMAHAKCGDTRHNARRGDATFPLETQHGTHITRYTGWLVLLSLGITAAITGPLSPLTVVTLRCRVAGPSCCC